MKIKILGLKKFIHVCILLGQIVKTFSTHLLDIKDYILFNITLCYVIVAFELPCTEDIPTCMETCGKLLECGIHECGEMCHIGPCSTVRMWRF